MYVLSFLICKSFGHVLCTTSTSLAGQIAELTLQAVHHKIYTAPAREGAVARRHPENRGHACHHTGFSPASNRTWSYQTLPQDSAAPYTRSCDVGTTYTERVEYGGAV